MSHNDHNISNTQLIDVYHNSCSVMSLYQVLIHELNTDFLLISWYISDNLWYIPIIYDKHMDSPYNMESWHITVDNEPTLLNIPIHHTSLQNAHILRYPPIQQITQTTTLPITTLQSINFVDQHKDNSNIYHSSVTQSIKLWIVYDAKIEPSKEYLFLIESFVNKLATEDLFKRSKCRSELMLSNICHSVRTPLNGILHMTNMLLAGNGSNIPVDKKQLQTDLNTEHLKYLNQSVVSLANSLFDIIDITQLELGKIKIVNDVFNISELLLSVVSVAHTLNKSKTVELVCHIEPTVPEHVYGDAKRIKQILINLVENALQHTSSGEISIYVQAFLINLAEEDGLSHNDASLQYDISFIVKDTGNGMDTGTKNALFQPMEILCNSKQQGISLRVSYLLAKYLGGKLSLCYSEPSRGSCFMLNTIMYESEPLDISYDTLKALHGNSVLILDDTDEKNKLCHILLTYGLLYDVANSYDEIVLIHNAKQYSMIIIHEKFFEHAQSIHILWPDAKFIAMRLNNSANTVDNKVCVHNTNLLGIFTDFIYIPCSESHYKTRLKEIMSDKPKQYACCYDIHILIIDDDNINCIILDKLLRHCGYKNISISQNGPSAMKLVNNKLINLETCSTQNNIYNAQNNTNGLYDLLLVDIRMPLMSGFELAEIVYRTYCEHEQKPPYMIGITAQLIQDDELTEYLYDFVYKPIDIEELNKKIKQLYKQA